jgi:hypothetical protein
MWSYSIGITCEQYRAQQQTWENSCNWDAP